MKRSPGPRCMKTLFRAELCSVIIKWRQRQRKSSWKASALQNPCACVCNGVRKWGEGKGGGGSSAVVSLLSAQIFLIQCLIKGGQSRLQRFIQAISGNPCNPEGNIGMLSQCACIFLRNVGLHLGMMWGWRRQEHSGESQRNASVRSGWQKDEWRQVQAYLKGWNSAPTSSGCTDYTPFTSLQPNTEMEMLIHSSHLMVSSHHISGRLFSKNSHTGSSWPPDSESWILHRCMCNVADLLHFYFPADPLGSNNLKIL